MPEPRCCLRPLRPSAPPREIVLHSVTSGLRSRMTTQDVDLPILEALSEEPSLSQRELARRAGLSLTRAHFVLKRLVEKGLVKVQNVAHSDHKLGYLYLLTPMGIEAKAKLTYAFLLRTAKHYQDMSSRVESALVPALRAQAQENERVRVAVVGDGPLSEVVSDLVALRADAVVEQELKLAHVAVVVDPDLDFHVAPGLTVVRLA